MPKANLPLIFICMIAILTSCQQGEVQVGTAETTTPQPTNTIQIIHSATEPLPTMTPNSQISLHGYLVQINELICPLKPVLFYGLHVFQADCGEDLWIPLGHPLDVQLLPPNDLELPITEIPDMVSIFGDLEPPFVFGIYQESDRVNTATFKVPQLKYSGGDILCGFSVPLQGEDVYIVVTGKTTRAP